MTNLLIPQCGHCHRFRFPDGSWHSNVAFAQLCMEPDLPWTLTTGICQDCRDEAGIMHDLGGPSPVLKHSLP